MKIAIIGPQGLPIPAVKGGAIETLIDVITKENEREKKLDIDIYTVFDKEAIEESKKYKHSNYIFLCKSKKYVFIKNKFISLFRKVLKKDFTYTYAKQIVKHMKKKNYDKVIIEGDSSLVVPISKIMDKEKIYLHIHHDPRTTNHDKFREELSLCSKIIAVSNYIKDGLLYCVRDKNLNIEVLQNCTNTSIFNKDLYKNNNELKLKYGIKENDIVVMFTGRPVPQKGVKELLVAFKEVIKSHNNVKLLIVGNAGFGNSIKTKYDEELKVIADTIKEKVVFTGFIDNNQIPYIHSISDISIVPSIYNDPAPLVVIESVCSGIPLITTDSGGIPEYIDNDCAIIVKRDEDIIENLKKQIENLILDKALRESMVKRAHVYRQKFSQEMYYRNYINILSK